MLVENLMTINPVTVTLETTLGDAAKIMLDQHFSGLPVVDASGKLVGIITEGDLLRRPELGTMGEPASWLMAFITPGRLANDYAHTHARHVREAMTADVITITRDTPLAEVAAVMLRRHIKRLPVMDADRVVGIVSRSDLLRALAPQLLKTETQHPAPEEIKRSIIDTIKKENWAPKSGNAVGVKRVIDNLVYTDANSGMVFPA
jgi:CBS domain-containing protein